MASSLPAVRENASNALANSREGIWKDQPEPTVFEIVANSREGQKDKWFPRLARIISGGQERKQPVYVSHLTGEKERTCYDWCNGAVDPPSRVLIKLLHSPVGGLVLQHLMRGCKQPWWADLERQRVLGEGVEQLQFRFQQSHQ